MEAGVIGDKPKVNSDKQVRVGGGGRKQWPRDPAPDLAASPFLPDRLARLLASY